MEAVAQRSGRNHHSHPFVGSSKHLVTKVQMVGSTKLPNSSYTSSIDEVQTFVRRCAEPRPAADQVKAAIRRASQRLGISFSRMRDIWRGNAEEMDRISREATKIELAHAIARIEVLRDRMQAARTPGSLQVVAGLDAALDALGLGSAELIPSTVANCPRTPARRGWRD
jgi:hypothetical protein